jgi:hypothetical protein
MLTGHASGFYRDLCAACESLPSTGALGGTHSIDHIMMKIPVPLGNAEVEQVSRRVRDQWLQQDAQAVAAAQAPIRIQTGRGNTPSGPNAPRPADAALSPPQRSPASQTSGITSPPLSTSPSSLPPPPVHPSRSAWVGPAGSAAPPPAPLPQGRAGREEAVAPESRSRIGPWSISLSSSGLSFRRTSSGGSAPSTAVPTRTGHRCSCDSCGAYLSGTRYQCANCPSDPVAFNLVRRCSFFWAQAVAAGWDGLTHHRPPCSALRARPSRTSCTTQSTPFFASTARSTSRSGRARR